MTMDQFEREKSYQVSIFIAKKMLKQNLIDKTEYQKINKKLIKKFNPVIGSLYI